MKIRLWKILTKVGHLEQALLYRGSANQSVARQVSFILLWTERTPSSSEEDIVIVSLWKLFVQVRPNAS